MFKKIIESFKKTTTSKKLTALIVAFWIMVIIADIIIYLITGNTINVVVDYVNTAFLVILGSYFGKSLIENVAKGIENNITSKATDIPTESTENQESQG